MLHRYVEREIRTWIFIQPHGPQAGEAVKHPPVTTQLTRYGLGSCCQGAGKAGEIVHLQTRDASLGQIQHASDGGKIRIGERAAGVNAGNLGENGHAHLLGPVAESPARG